MLDVERAQRRCINSELSCFTLGKLAMIERELDPLVVIPTGDAHAFYYSFEIFCLQECTPFAGALMRLHRRRDLDFQVRLRFYGDGERILNCRIGRFDYPALQRRLWTSASCDTASVEDRRPWHRRWFGLS